MLRQGHQKHRIDTEPDVILRIEDPVQMTYTSGTESLPKGVIISNQALIAEYMGAIIDGRYESSDININALPIYHCAQRDVFMNPIFWMGGTNIFMAPDIGMILKNIAKYKATMFFAPPTVWIGMLRHPDFDKYDLSSLIKCYYGASIMPREILRELLEKFPKAGIYNYYGQTELAPYHTILKAEDAMEKIGSAGIIEPAKMSSMAHGLLRYRQFDLFYAPIFTIPLSGRQRDLLDEPGDAPVITLVNQLLARAVQSGASDLHIEPHQQHKPQVLCSLSYYQAPVQL